MIIPKKERRKHSNVVENDLRKLVRTTFRENDVNLVINDAEGKSHVAKDFKVSPAFAALTEKIMKEGNIKLNKKKRMEAMMGMTEIWSPDSIAKEDEEINAETPKKKTAKTSRTKKK